VLAGEQHERIYAQWAEPNPQFGVYQQLTARIIVAIELVPRAR